MTEYVPYRFEVIEGTPPYNAPGLFVVWDQLGGTWLARWIHRRKQNTYVLSLLGRDEDGNMDAWNQGQRGRELVRYAPLPMAFDGAGNPYDIAEDDDGEAEKPAQS